MKKLLLTIILLKILLVLSAQDSIYIRNTISTLASEKYYGRGYVRKGDKQAAWFIQQELKQINAFPLSKNYLQKLNFPINTFPGKMELSINEEVLNPVYDYVIAPNSPSVSGKFSLVYFPASADTIDAIFDSLCTINYGDKFVVAPFSKRKLTHNNPIQAAGVLVPKSSIIWWASNAYEVTKTPLFIIKDSIIETHPKSIEVNVHNKFYESYESQNVIGLIPGTEQTDSFLVFTAHYDHLGAMGKGNIFHGANDNASGATMVLCLANYYSKNKPKYSTVFIFFSGEEAGLIGSHYFTQNPLIDLNKIKALINLDMVGSGSEGIALVNGKNTPWITQRIKSINNKHNYFPKIKIRGESCNSDHCFFHKAGVPSVFIYTDGKEHSAYHVLDDSPENLPLTKFNELFKLLVECCE